MANLLRMVVRPLAQSGSILYDLGIAYRIEPDSNSVNSANFLLKMANLIGGSHLPMNYALDFIYYTVRPAGTYIASHQHHCHELVYYREGCGSTRIRQTDHVINGGRFALIHPLSPHDETHDTDGDVFFIGFSYPDSGIPLPEGVFEDPEGPGSALYAILDRMKDEMAEQRPYRSEQLNLLTGMAVIELARRFRSAAPPNNAAERLHYARRYMDEHFQQKVNLEYLADLSGYSYDRFRHLFKEAVGVPPLQYLHAKRLEHACRLLRHTGKPLWEIAEESGFGGSAPFSTLFHRAYGMTPREYRSRLT